MLASPEGSNPLEPVQGSNTETAESTAEFPCFRLTVDEAGEACPDTESGDIDSQLTEELAVRPLRDAVLDEGTELVVGSDDDAAVHPDSPLQPLAALFGREEPLMWVFAGARMAGDHAFVDGRLTGEWFAEEWRAETGRATDLFLDATWPDCTLAILKSHLKTRVVRHRPDVAVLFLERTEASEGIESLSQFERRLLAVLSVLAEIGANVVLVQPPVDEASADIDQEVYFEAISGIARERGVPHLVLPRATAVTRTRTPNSPARETALFLCREAQRVCS